MQTNAHVSLREKPWNVKFFFKSELFLVSIKNNSNLNLKELKIAERYFKF